MQVEHIHQSDWWSGQKWVIWYFPTSVSVNNTTQVPGFSICHFITGHITGIITGKTFSLACDQPSMPLEWLAALTPGVLTLLLLAFFCIYIYFMSTYLFVHILHDYWIYLCIDSRVTWKRYVVKERNVTNSCAKTSSNKYKEKTHMLHKTSLCVCVSVGVGVHAFVCMCV